MGSGQRRGRRVARDIAISFLITVVLLAAAEGVARLLHPPLGYFMVPTRDNCLQRSASLGVEFRADCATTWSDFLLTGKGQTTFRTNRLGLRDDEIEDDGAARILSLGDSCTWGWQVGQNDAYPQALQRLLDAKVGPGRYRVINAGVPGYTTYQGLVHLRERSLSLNPAIVIIAYGFNDSLPNGDVEEDLDEQRRTLLLVKADDFLLTHSTLWRALRTVIRDGVPSRKPSSSSERAPGGPPVEAPAARPAPANAPAGPSTRKPLRVPPEKFVRNLKEMITLVREHGARPLLISFMGEPGGKDPYGRAIGSVATETNTPLLVYYGPRIDIVHPSADGYELLATRILDRLQAEGYVGSVGPDGDKRPQG